MATNESVTKFQRLFNSIPDKMKPDLIFAAHYQASRLARAMTFAAPREKGNLRDSIRVEEGRRSTRFLVRAGGPKTTRGGYDYALANEFGTSKMPAQPFFWPTYRAERKRIRRDLNRAIKDTLKKQVAIRG